MNDVSEWSNVVQVSISIFLEVKAMVCQPSFLIFRSSFRQHTDNLMYSVLAITSGDAIFRFKNLVAVRTTAHRPSSIVGAHREYTFLSI